MNTGTESTWGMNFGKYINNLKPSVKNTCKKKQEKVLKNS